MPLDIKQTKLKLDSEVRFSKVENWSEEEKYQKCIESKLTALLEECRENNIPFFAAINYAQSSNAEKTHVVTTNCRKGHVSNIIGVLSMMADATSEKDLARVLKKILLQIIR